MAKIGTGLSMLRLAPSKSGLYSPPTPTMTVQVPDTGGSTGNSKGGAGNVTNGSAIAADGTSINAMRAARRRSRCAFADEFFSRRPSNIIIRQNDYLAHLAYRPPH